MLSTTYPFLILFKVFEDEATNRELCAVIRGSTGQQDAGCGARCRAGCRAIQFTRGSAELHPVSKPPWRAMARLVNTSHLSNTSLGIYSSACRRLIVPSL